MLTVVGSVVCLYVVFRCMSEAQSIDEQGGSLFLQLMASAVGLLSLFALVWVWVIGSGTGDPLIDPFAL